MRITRKVIRMSTERTIVAVGHFGDITMTKEKYIETWSNQVEQLRKLDYDEIWQNKVEDMMMVVRNKAANEFNRLFKVQNTDITSEFS